MSDRYPGGFITKATITPAGPYADGAASGIWTLQQQIGYVRQGIWPTAGLYPGIQDFFSTNLYTGNSTTNGSQTITTNLNLDQFGGMVWIKGRDAASDHILTDTVRGSGTSATSNRAISSNLSAAQNLGGAAYDFLDSFNPTGFLATQGGTTEATRGTNYNAINYVSWSFRKQQKFFDIVSYTGTGSNRTVAHNLGSIPGCIIIKKTDSSANWRVYHRSLGNTKRLSLNNSDSADTDATTWNNTTPTASVFSLGTEDNVNDNGDSYIAYLFAHNAGGFGATFTDNVVSCDSFSTDGSGNATIDLGYEPQFVIIKNANNVGDWGIWDASRVSPSKVLYANLANIEATSTDVVFSGSGFSYAGAATNTFVYIAIRKGPM